MSEEYHQPKLVNHHLVEAFDKAFREATKVSTFAFGGTFVPPQMKQGDVLICVDSVKANSVAKLAAYKVPLNDKSAQALYDAGVVSPHGRGNKTVYDASYRDAHEVKPPNVTINVDLLNIHTLRSSTILSQIEHTIKTGPLTVEFNKLNMYAKGGFFKSHRDTALGPRHIGSIVICLPSKFQGGALVVEKDGVEMTFDFASSIAKLSKSPKAVSWAFLYADCKHEVLPVESGVRVTLAYDVYVQKPEAIPNRGDDPVTTVCGPLLKRLLLDRQKKWFSQQPFLPKGGLVGIGLRHEYPAKYIKQGSEDTDTLLHAENLSHVLKGVDKEIHALIVKTGLDWEFNGIYDEDRDNRGDYSDHGLDGYSETLRSEPGSGPWGDILRAPGFFLFQRGPHFYTGNARSYGAKSTHDVHWLSIPEAFLIKSPYNLYAGNEGETEYTYVAAAIIIELPPVDGSTQGHSQLFKNGFA